uniref:Uncharacterized protein n=2 Tax=Caenorhabditis japonica TaxID=281687 RepID=A0A8R1I7E3_CAEJA
MSRSLGNDLLSQLPKFVFDYAKACFLIGEAILPMGNQYESSSSPGNQTAHPEERIAYPAHDDRSTSTSLLPRTPSAPPKQPSTTIQRHEQNTIHRQTNQTISLSSPMSSPSRKKRPKSPDLPTTKKNPTISSQMSTYDVETPAQRLISKWENDYDIEFDVCDQEEEDPPPPPEEEPEETYAPESDFAVPTIIHGVQVPAKQKTPPVC